MPFRELRIESPKPIPAQIDGEVMAPSDLFEILVFPKALRIIVPRTGKF